MGFISMAVIDCAKANVLPNFEATITNQLVEGKEWMVNGQQFSSKELYGIYPIFVDHTEAPKMF